jgi:predicted  nucleic acid-binding Zn-ribbon protein
VKEELVKLIELQKYDRELKALRDFIQTADERRAKIEQEFDQHASSIRELQKKREDLATQKVNFERQLSDSKVYLGRAERNLKHSQNQKEYESAMREIESLQKKIAALETSILETMAQLEEAEKQLAERADEINTYEARRSEALTAFDNELRSAQANLEEHIKNRQQALSVIPANLARTYDRLASRTRDGIAVAQVINGACSSCNMSLRPQMLVEVRRGGDIVYCENCSRILYFPEAEAAINQA